MFLMPPSCLLWLSFSMFITQAESLLRKSNMRYSWKTPSTSLKNIIFFFLLFTIGGRPHKRYIMGVSTDWLEQGLGLFPIFGFFLPFCWIL